MHNKKHLPELFSVLQLYDELPQPEQLDERVQSSVGFAALHARLLHNELQQPQEGAYNNRHGSQFSSHQIHSNEGLKLQIVD